MADQGDCSYRAQVLSNDGSTWVNGGLFRKRINAEKDAVRLADLYGNRVRLVEEEHHVSHRG